MLLADFSEIRGHRLHRQVLARRANKRGRQELCRDLESCLDIIHSLRTQLTATLSRVLARWLGSDDKHDSVFNDRPSLGNPGAPSNSFGIDGSFVGGIPQCEQRPLVGLPGRGNVGRNTGNGPGWTKVDLRFTKKFILRKAVDKTETTREIDLRADAFNVLNHTNYKNYVGTVTSALLGFANDAYPARELPLGIRSSF